MSGPIDSSLPANCHKQPGLPLLNRELLEACIHCGLCLPACPTYLASGLEAESPRGRIYMLNMLGSGQIEKDDPVLTHIDSCLGCMGCKTACPSGVDYDKILKEARLLRPSTTGVLRALLRFFFAVILPNYFLLKVGGAAMRLAQRTGLTRLKLSLPFAPRLSQRIAQWQALLPEVPPRRNLTTTAGSGETDVQLFSGCVMDILYNNVNRASLRLLHRQGRRPGVPDQTCCGALAAHAGEHDIARRLARQNIAKFEKTGGEIAVTSAGCGAMLKEYAELLEDDPDWHERAERFSKRVKDISEVLSAGRFSSTPVKKGQVAYHAACHLAHVQKVRRSPVELLSLIEGTELMPLEEHEHCCGSAGIYNFLHTETSLAVLERKIQFLKLSGAKCVATGNPGCLLQLQAGVAMHKLPIRVAHPVELLDEAFGDDHH